MTTGEPTSRGTVHGLVEDAIGRYGTRTALVDGPSGRSVDYAELGGRVERIAAWLAHDGVGPGDRLAVWSPNLPPAAAVTLAALRVGAAVVPLSPAWTVAEAAGLARDAGANVVAAAPPLVARAHELGPRRVLSLGESANVISLGELLEHGLGPAPTHVVTPDDVAFVCASSGTTGTPKGVLLTHRQTTAVCTRIAEAFELVPTDVTLAIAPWFHILGLTAELLVPLTVGATVVSVPTFDPTQAFALLDDHAVTYLAVPPPVASAILHHPAAAGRSFERLALLAVGGAPLSAGLQHALAARLPGCAIGQGWGLTETGGALCVPSRTGGAPAGTVGVPLPDTEVRVVDPDTGAACPAGRVGELQARGPQLMLGYLNRPDETAAAITRDGWLRTGDLGHVDAQGVVAVTGRIKDLIKVNALQVSPTEVEEALLTLPGVQDAAVVGRPHDRTGETPIAFLVTDGTVDPDGVRNALRGRLAGYKVPTEVRVVDRLPRTPSGKLLRRELLDAPSVTP